MISTLWDNTRRELDFWTAQGLKAIFWVRDDDAFETSVQLARLHDLAVRHDISIGLAVIPANLHPGLPLYLSKDERRFHPMCHGWQHINYAGSGCRPAEFGRERPLAALVNDACSAYRAFSDYFGEVDAVFVPPFGRITKTLVRTLPEIGFIGVSGAAGWLERKLSHLSDLNIRIPTIGSSCWSSIPRLDVQIDPIDWQGGTAHDPATISQSLVRCLRARRNGLLASNLPIGLVTHHLAHDENVWRTCDTILRILRSHEAVEFLRVDHFFREIASAGP
jgi:hypothetical protein